MPSEENRPRSEFKLPDTPWTIGSDGFNPMLQPSNSVRQRAALSKHENQREPVPEFLLPSLNAHASASSFAVPPYHPSYNAGAERKPSNSSASTSSSPGREDSDESGSDIHHAFKADRPDASERVQVRRRSEGWEVRPTHSDIQQWDVEAWQKDFPSPPDKYRRYVPESSSEEDEDEENADDEDWGVVVNA